MPPPQTALLTGASRGIGLSLLSQLSSLSYHIVSLSRTHPPNPLPNNSYHYSADLLDPSALSEIVAHSLVTLPHLSALIANAAVCPSGWPSLMSSAYHLFLRTFDTNVAAHVALLRALLPLLLAAPDADPDEAPAVFVAVSSGDGEMLFLAPALQRRLEYIASSASVLAGVGIGFACSNGEDAIAALRSITEDVANTPELERDGIVHSDQPAYSLSKACLNVVVRIVHREIEEWQKMNSGDSIIPAPRLVAVALCPGDVRTAMGAPDAVKSPERAARDIMELIGRARRREIVGGTFWRDGELINW